MLESETTVLRSEGHHDIAAFRDSRGVLETIGARDAEAVLLDLTLPRGSGERLLLEIRQGFPHVPVIVITGTADLDTAVRCMKEGAFDYMVKPVERNRFVSSLRRATEFGGLRREVSELRSHLLDERLQNPEAFSEIKTQSRTMLSIFRYMEAISRSNEPVLIVGETGVGKELVARALHRLSGCSGELLPVNTAGLDDTMLSDTLFGHRKGAYTGAADARGGLLTAADGGTLFLDEIGDTPPTTQVRLLRMVETGEYFPLGSEVARRTRTRFIFVTNRNLEYLKDPAVFRQDLYYRLSTHQIVIPPLRERREDIPLLVAHFLAEACAALGKDLPPLPDHLHALESRYDFPGNVRELRALVFDAVGRMSGTVLPMEPFEMAAQSSRAATACSDRTERIQENPPTLKRMTEQLIRDALEQSSGNIAEAARLLGISRQALSKRLNRRQRPG